MTTDTTIEPPTIQQAVRAIAMQCDGASKRDDIGFNGRDTKFGKSLAAIPHDDWSLKQLECAHIMLATYKGQLSRLGIEYAALRGPVLEAGYRKQVREELAARTVAARPPSKREIPRRITREEGKNRWLLEFPYDAKLIGRLKALGLKSFLDEPTGRWLWPVYEARIAEVLPAVQDFDGAADMLASIAEREADENALVQASGATTSEEVVHLPGGKLRGFQAAGVSYMARVKRVLNADEMGLGKTLQALATIEKLKAYPALIVSPASLKLNWKAEYKKFMLNDRWVEVLDGRDTKPSGKAEVYIANYEILQIEVETAECGYCEGGKHKDCTRCKGKGLLKKKRGKVSLKGTAKHLSEIQLKAIAFDEFHYCKNPKSDRSQSAKLLASNIDIRIGLTGTPIKSRPKELANQLDIIGRLEKDFGGFMRFAKTYCAAVQEKHGWNMDGASNTQDLHRKLRATCYVRRTKEEVLPELPPKVWAKLPVEISNRSEYQSAEADFLDWLIENEGAARAERASRAEELTRMNLLLQLAGRGKLEAVSSWVEGFLESGEKLVLFADHIEVQNALLKRFGDAASAIQGGQNKDKIETAKRLFCTTDKVNLIVCSIKAGGVGHNLHADGKCSSVALMEFPWTPADVDQCVDRVHRMGQVAESVNVWQLYAPGTIDDHILALLEEKRIVVDAVTDGVERERIQAQNVEEELLGLFKRRAQERAREKKNLPKR